MSKETAMAEIKDFLFPTTMDSDYTPEEMADMTDGVDMRYPQITIPSGGALAFEVPTDDPDEPDTVKKIECVIVDQHPMCVYWPNRDALGEPPQCASNDGKIGAGDPGGECAKCPLNEWASGEGGSGKACQNRRNLYILMHGDHMPKLLSLPPTSLKAFGNYINFLLANGELTNTVLTEISLKKVEGAAGNNYSQAVFKKVSKLSPELKTASREYTRSIKQFTRKQPAVSQSAAYDAPVDVSDGNSPF